MSNLVRLTWNISKTRKMVFLAMWTAIIIVMALIPNVGYIMINPAITLTTLQIPVIIGAILLGPAEGAFLGLVFGVTSMLQAPFLQPATAFLFNPFVPLGSYKSALIAIVPRVLIGLAAAYTFKLVARYDRSRVVACVTGAVAGGLTTSILVLGGLFVFFTSTFGKTASAALKALSVVFVSNSILEIAVTAVIVPAVCKALFAVMKRTDIKRR